jgi:membrane protease YdiL (CAAX protease family)
MPHERKRRRLCWTAALLATVLTGYGSWRVALLERTEFAEESAPATLRARMRAEHATHISARLGSARIAAGQFAVFELCAAHDLAAPVYRNAFDVAVLDLAAEKLLLRVPLDPAHLAHVRTTAAGSCMLLGSGSIEHAGAYSVEATWQAAPPTAAEVLDNPLVTRVLGKTPLRSLDVAVIAALGAVLLASCVGLLIWAPERSTYEATWGRWPALSGPCAALVFVYALMQWPSLGALATTLKGVVLLGVLSGLAWTVARSGGSAVGSALGLVQPRSASAWLLALAAWPTLIVTARLALRIVPSTSEAPLQTFISWPSGMLAAALLGVLLPIGEELFFRGLLVGAWSRFGQPHAAVYSTLAFGALHAQQSWGNWGGLIAVFVTGATLVTLRIWSGSTWIALLSHIAYNLTLSLSSLASATASAF